MDDDSDHGEDNYHYKVLVIRSKTPVLASLTLSCDADVKELKSHDIDENAFLKQFSDAPTITHQGTVVDSSRSKAIWSTIHGEPESLSRSSSSTSSFAIISDNVANDFEYRHNSVYAEEKSNASSFQNVATEKLRNGEEEEEDNKDTVTINNSDDDDDDVSSLGGMVMLTLNRNDKATECKKSDDSDAKDFFEPPEIYSDALVCLAMEFCLRIVEVLKEQDKSTITPVALSLNYLERILTCEAFLELPMSLLTKILSLRRNDATIEAALAKSIVKWSEKSAERVQYLPNLLRSINISSLTTEQLIDLGRMQLIRCSLECRDIIDVAKNGLLMTMSTSLNTNDSFQRYLYILARGYHKTWEYSVHQINLISGHVRRIPSKPAILLASLADSLFIFTHRSPMCRSVEVYNLERKMWTSMTNWPVDLIISSMCTYGRCIYFVASIGVSHNFYKYDPTSDEFRMILTPSRLVIREDDKIVAFEKQILFISSGAAYDVTLYKWNFYAPFPSNMSTSILTVHKDRIIFPGGSDRLHWVDPKNRGRGIHSNWHGYENKPGRLIDLVVIQSKLYLIEKCSNGVYLQMFDDESGVWNRCSKVDLQAEPIRCAISNDD